MRVLVSGSSGLIGTALVHALEQRGDSVTRLVRSPTSGPGEVHWEPSRNELDVEGVAGHDAVVHLAGAGIGDHRWTEEHRRAVLDSRVDGTTLLSDALAGLPEADRPRVMASGSAIGFYGDRADEPLTEEANPGTGFLADVVQQWEASTTAADAAGIRVAHLRTGVVLAGHGGALKQMLLPFKLGIGGRQGSGRQWMSWIALEDEVAAITTVLDDDRLVGPVNLTAPNPVTNGEFARTLGRVLHRPAVLPTPTPALKALYGSQLVDEVLLAGQRVIPQRLQETGYVFRQPHLEGALRTALG